MSEKSKIEKKNMQLCLLGVSFDTGNMGVSALAESSIKVMLSRWPDAKVTLLGVGMQEGEHRLRLTGRDVKVGILRMRFSKHVYLRSHFCVLLLNAVLLKLLPWRKFRNLLSTINPYVKTLAETDKVFDITGGDSFSDIYGFRRFLMFGFLQKWLITQFGKELVLLPQTYGPFKRSITRLMARCILKRAGVVYARDHGSVECIRGLTNHSNNGKIRFMPDVAFVLDIHEPDHLDVGKLSDNRKKDSIVVGLNVSGLLINGGYTQENMFGLKTNYSELVYDIVDLLMKDKRLLLLLVPHVFAPSGNVESDPDACLKVYEELNGKYPGRIFLTRGEYNQNEIKYIIGLCDFFIGSRMHACIAALSQSIPAIGIAYSKKFQGVFESIELEDCVADTSRFSKDEILSIIGAAFEKRDRIRLHLNKVIPEVKKNILNMFESLNV